MADRLLMVSWGQVARGREGRALEVFNDAVGMYGRMLAEGRVERFEVRLLTPNSDLAGYFEIEGTPEQLVALKEDADFRRSMADAALIVDRLQVLDGYTNEGVADQMALYTEAIQRIAQPAA